MTTAQGTSLGLAPLSLVIGGLLFGTVTLGGCVIERYERTSRDSTPRCTTPGPAEARAFIEPDERLEAPPGEGAGVFVEYESGGRWHVWATCDTRLTGRACHFDVLAQTSTGSIRNVVGDALAPGDSLTQDCTDTAQLLLTSRSDISGMFFETQPGATVVFDVLVDGVPYPELVYWYGSFRETDASDVRYGAPGNPIALTPRRP